ncbi:uncharacterized protein LOC144428147 [Styela clava]
MSVQCKAYLLKDGSKEPTEIRSFRIEEGAATNYDYLRRKIATIFPSLGWDEDGSRLKLLWKDSAGDFITFSSDEELISALGEIAEDGIFRVFIKQIAQTNREFPWQEYIGEMWKSLNEETANERGCGSGFGSHPYSRRGGCGARRGGGCGSRRRGVPFGVSFSPFGFPGFHAEVWSFDADKSVPSGCCGKRQKQDQSQQDASTSKDKETKNPPQDKNAPSTSK